MKWLVGLFLCLIITVAYLMISQSIEIVTPGVGVVSGMNENIDIITPDSGFVNLLSTKVGEEIKKDEILFSYVNLDDYSKEKSIKNILVLLDSNINENLKNVSDLYFIYDQIEKGSNERLIEKAFNDSPNIKKVVNNYNALLETKTINENKEKIYLDEKLILHNQIKYIKDKLDLYYRSNSPKIDIIETKNDIAKLEMAFIETNEKILINNQLYTTHLNDFKIDLLKQIENLVTENKNLKREKLEYEDSMNHVKSRMKANIIRSPVDGIILSMDHAFTVGSFIVESQRVISLKQAQNSNIVKGSIEARYRPFIKLNSKVKIVIDTPGSEFYSMGEIIKISADSFIENEKNNTRTYKVDIEPENSKLFDKELVGVQVKIYIMNYEVNILNYITALLSNNLYFTMGN